MKILDFNSKNSSTFSYEIVLIKKSNKGRRVCNKKDVKRADGWFSLLLLIIGRDGGDELR